MLQISRLGGGVPIVADGVAAQTGARFTAFRILPSRVVYSGKTVMMGVMEGIFVDAVCLGAKLRGSVMTDECSRYQNKDTNVPSASARANVLEPFLLSSSGCYHFYRRMHDALGIISAVPWINQSIPTDCS